MIFTIIEAYGDLFSRTFAIPGIGHSFALGFIEDLFAVLVLAGLVTFAIIRLRQNPEHRGRKSRFYGSHTGAAWLVLAGIFLVVATLLLYRGAQIDTGVFPYAHGAFASQEVGHWLHPLGRGVNSVLEATFVLAQLGVILAFGVFVTYSKHLHIALAPLNVLFSRRPNALGPLEPMRSDGKVLDFEEADPDTDVFGLGKIEDFTWKGLLDLATCTECGRCQSQCPAWATGKPLSPKQVILDLRDHAFAKAPYLLAASGEEREPSLTPSRKKPTAPWSARQRDNGVIDPDVLWSCTNCGACVEECPVDIEHIDHIDGMRRHQVLIESAFPVEAAGMLKNLENKGDPWGMGPTRRGDWITELDFEIPVVDGAIGDDIEYLFWVGCAGSFDDRAKKTTKATAELMHTAGVDLRGARPGGDLHRGPGPPDRQRVRLLHAGPAEHRDAQLRRATHDRGDRVPTASTPWPTNTPSWAATTRSSTTAVAGQAGGRRQAHPRRPGRGEDHLPRPVLPRPAQRGLHPAPGDHRRVPGTQTEEAPLQEPRLLLRGGRRPDVDGRAHRQAHQHRAHRRGPGPGPGHRVHRVPVLPGDAG